MSIGGDNYCYSGVDKLGYYNRMIHEKGAKTVLWGCSVEPSVLNDKVIKDLKLYDLITVRESITYNALVEAGIKNNVVLCSDPAFQLDKACVELPYGFTSQNTVGINVSPLVIEMGNYVLENYIELVRYILEETELNILLVPHVVKEDSDDRKAIEKLKSYFSDSDRIAMTQDYNCEKIKGFISQCRMFIGARTHATIAAYSTCVPTLVAGYSVKAKGIAKDIFGSYENYVISVQNFSSENDLKDSFIWLCENEQKIRDYLKDKMPGYCGDSYIAEKELRRLTNND